MNNLFNLIKINLLTFFNIGNIRNANTKDELKKAIFKLLIIIVGVGYFSMFLYDTMNDLMKGFITLNVPYILIVLSFVLVSIFILFTNVFRINGVLFNFKDYDLLMSLPIKKKDIIISKLFTIYLGSLFYDLIFMIPTYIVYIKNVNEDIVFSIVYFITLFIIPLVPIVVATIIGSILTVISSKLHFKNIANLIISLALVIGIMYLSASMESKNIIDMANIGNSMVDIFNKYYPLTNLYTTIINNSDFISLLLFILIPIILFSIFILVINKNYKRINSNLMNTYTKNNYKLKNYKVSSQLNALYKKELKRFFSSPIYILNTSIGAILLVLAILGFIIFGSDKIDALIGIEGLSDMFIKTGPLVMGAFCMLNCTTYPSISLEGKNLWIIKSLPVSPMTIYMSKILVNLTIIIPAIIISAISLGIYLHVDIFTFIFLFITPLFYSLFIAMLGIIINLIFPNFNWKNEVRVIKQSIASFITIMIGMLLAIIPFNIDLKTSNNLFILLITSIILILNIVLFIVLKTYGVKRFKEL